MNELNERFIEFYNYLNLQKTVKSAKEFAEILDISSSLITEIMKNRSIVGSKPIQNSVLNFNLNSDWLFTGRGEMIINEEKIEKSVKPLDIGTQIIDKGSFDLIMDRYEALVEENSNQKKEIIDLKNQLQNSKITPAYKLPGDGEPLQCVADESPNK